jgi:hypothetical protein
MWLHAIQSGEPKKTPDMRENKGPFFESFFMVEGRIPLPDGMDGLGSC